MRKTSPNRAIAVSAAILGLLATSAQLHAQHALPNEPQLPGGQFQMVCTFQPVTAAPLPEPTHAIPQRSAPTVPGGTFGNGRNLLSPANMFGGSTIGGVQTIAYDDERWNAAYGQYLGNGTWRHEQASPKQVRLVHNLLKERKASVVDYATKIGLRLDAGTQILDLKKGEASLLIKHLRK